MINHKDYTMTSVPAKIVDEILTAQEQIELLTHHLQVACERITKLEAIAKRQVKNEKGEWV